VSTTSSKLSASIRVRRVNARNFDIEGTTTPISFVYDVLFLSRQHVAEHVRHADLSELKREYDADRS
jgi:methionine salvage enolase-phosphatase E1